MKKPNHDRIFLLPEDGVWCWADRPAPGIGQSNDDAVEYVRADLFDQVTAQRDSATSQLETARTAINNNFNQLREHADKMQAERDAALAQNAELVAQVEELKELAGFWIAQSEPRNASKQEYNTWLSLGYESACMRLSSVQLARIKAGQP